MRIAEEEEPVPLGTPRNLTRTVVLNQVGITPGGTRRILKSARYNFKEGVAGETEEQARKRLEVRRKSRKRALDSLDPEKQEQQNAKRRKAKQPEAAAAATEVAALPAAAALLPAAALPAEAPMEQAEAADRETQRDRALLRAWVWHRGDAEAMLAELRERGLDALGEEDEPWTAQHVQLRHQWLCRAVRTFARLLPQGADMRRVYGLIRLCS